MTAKEYLQRYLDTDREINIKLDEIHHLRELSIKTTQALLPEERPSMAALVAKIVDLENEVDASVDRLVEVKTEIENLVDSIGDHRYREVLRLRYIAGMTWHEIAEFMHYSERNIAYLHDQALMAVFDRIA